MTAVACPTCGEKGNLPDHLIGKRIKCPKCGQGFLTGAAPAATSSPAGPSIEVDGLDPSSWASTTAVVEEPGLREPAPTPEATGRLDGPIKQYKVLSSKDRFFEGKYEFNRLEEALNHYARQGWVVRGMATPHVTGFSGGPREELVIILER